MKGFYFLFFIAFFAKAEHPQNITKKSTTKIEDTINKERLDKGAKALAERVAGILVCTVQNAPGGSKSSTLEWYFASALSIWNNEVLEKLSTAKEISLNKNEFKKHLKEALLTRTEQKELPPELVSSAETLSDSIEFYTNNVLVHNKKLGAHSTQSMSRFDNDLNKKIRKELGDFHLYSKENKAKCVGTEKKTGFWAHVSLVPDNQQLSSAEKRREEEADKKLVEAAKEKPVETPTGNEELEKDIEKSLVARNESFNGDGKKSAEKKVVATIYYVPDENNYSSEKHCTILGKNGSTLAKVNCAFKKELGIQGTGILSDGRTVNYSSKNRYMVTPHKYGLGSSMNPLIPFRSLAIDVNYWKKQGINVQNGDKIYIKSTDGMKIPGTNEVHNGVWQVCDRGGKIKGNRIDLFFGTMSWRKALSYLEDRNNFSETNSDTAQVQNIGNKNKTLSMNFIL